MSNESLECGINPDILNEQFGLIDVKCRLEFKKDIEWFNETQTQYICSICDKYLNLNNFNNSIT